MARLVGLVLFGWISALSSVQASMDWPEYFRLDRRYNIPDYSPLKDRRSNEEASFRFYFWNVSQRDLKKSKLSYESRRFNTGDLDPAVRSLFAISDNGIPGRVFSPEGDGFEAYRILRARLGEPDGEIKAIPISGHSSFAIQEPRTGRFLTLKVSRQFKTNNRGYRNSHLKSFTGALVSAVLREEQAGLSLHFPESLQLTLADLSQEVSLQSILVRELSSVSDELEENQVVLPVHALLDSESKLIEKFAFSMGLSRQAWLRQEYLPPLAKFMAYLIFQKGLFHESHSQNLNIVIDTESGRVVDFRLRDLQDSYFVRLLRFFQNRSAPSLQLLVNGKNLGTYTGEDNYYYRSDFSFIAKYAEFLAQSFAFIDVDGKDAGRYSEIFFYHFMEHMSSELQVDIQLSDRAKQVLEALSETTDRRRRYLIDQIDFIFRSLFYQFVQEYFRKTARNSDFRYQQMLLRDFYVSVGFKYGYVEKLPVARKETYDDSENHSQFLYGFNGRLIYRRHLGTGEIDSIFPQIPPSIIAPVRVPKIADVTKANTRLNRKVLEELITEEFRPDNMGVQNFLKAMRAKKESSEVDLGLAQGYLVAVDATTGKILASSQKRVPLIDQTRLVDCAAVLGTSLVESSSRPDEKVSSRQIKTAFSDDGL